MTIIEGLVMIVGLFVAAVVVASLNWALLQAYASGRLKSPVGSSLYGLGMLAICVVLALPRWNGAAAAVGDLQNKLYLSALIAATAVSVLLWLGSARGLNDRGWRLQLSILLFGACLGLAFGTLDWTAAGREIVGHLLPLLFFYSGFVQLLRPTREGESLGERLRKLEKLERAHR